MNYINAKKEGECARTACHNMNFGYVHRDTGLKYCGKCARLINEAARQALCIRVNPFEMKRVCFPCGCVDIYLRQRVPEGHHQPGKFTFSEHQNCLTQPCPMYDRDAAGKVANP